MANCEKTMPTMPPINNKGKKTQIVVSVEAEIALAISPLAKTAACFGREPSSICRLIFSKTTVALSTTIPEATTNAIKEKIFMV